MIIILCLSLVRIYFNLYSLFLLVCKLHEKKKKICLIYHSVTSAYHSSQHRIDVQ